MATPTFGEVIAQAIDSRLLDVHTALPGKVTKYDAAKQVADVQIVIRRAALKLDGEQVLEDFPIIPNVPVAWPRGGGCYLHFPLAEGDHVLLVFSESAIGQWRESGQIAEPGDLARHDLSYPIAIPGIAPNAGKFADAPASSEAVLIVQGGRLRVSTSGGSAEFVALANLVQQAIDAIQTTFDAHTHPYTDTPVGPSVTLVPASPIGPLGPVASATLAAE